VPSYEEAIETLYRGAPEVFVAERKRLALELKEAGDKDAAKKVGALEKPSISVWAVNQLYWHERKRFDELLALAKRLRTGDLKAAAAHREALAELRRAAAERLRDAGNAANEATLRKVSASLAAIAAGGGFDPDPPGALRADRDPPGFGELDAASFAALPKKQAETRGAHDEPATAKKDGKKKDGEKKDREKKDREKENREREAREKKEREEQRAKVKAEQRRLQAELRAAEGELAERERELERVRRRVADAEDAVTKKKAALDRATERLRELE